MMCDVPQEDAESGVVMEEETADAPSPSLPDAKMGPIIHPADDQMREADEEEEEASIVLPQIPGLIRGKTRLTIGEFYAPTPTPEMPKMMQDDGEESSSLILSTGSSALVTPTVPDHKDTAASSTVSVIELQLPALVEPQDILRTGTSSPEDLEKEESEHHLKSHSAPPYPADTLPALRHSTSRGSDKDLLAKAQVPIQDLQGEFGHVYKSPCSHWKGTKRSSQSFSSRASTLSNQSTVSMFSTVSDPGSMRREKTVLSSTNFELLTRDVERKWRNGDVEIDKTSSSSRLPILSPSQAPYVALQRSRTFYEVPNPHARQPTSILKSSNMKKPSITPDKQPGLPRMVTFLVDNDLPSSPGLVSSIPSQRLQRFHTQLNLKKEQSEKLPPYPKKSRHDFTKGKSSHKINNTYRSSNSRVAKFFRENSNRFDPRYLHQVPRAHPAPSFGVKPHGQIWNKQGPVIPDFTMDGQLTGKGVKIHSAADTPVSQTKGPSKYPVLRY